MSNTVNNERSELIEIFNGLPQLLQKQLLTTARIIENTSDIIKSKKKKKSKGE